VLLFFFQTHKLEDKDDDSYMKLILTGGSKFVRSWAPWSIHNKSYRIIVEPMGSSRKDENRFRDIARGDNYESMREKFENLEWVVERMMI